jgi:signal transduction histidine kinase/CheY-like chemotaxis protein
MVGLETLDEARRAHVRDFFFPEDQSRIMDEFFPSVAANGHGEIEVRFRHFKTGAARWMAYKVLGLTDASEKIVAFGTVSQDVTERRKMEDDLRRLAADLSDADRRKDEFLALLSHELRNPLAPLHNMLEFLKRAGGNTETLPRAIDMMERQLGHLVRLVDDLLDLSRITHNRLELRKDRIELAPVIHQAVQAALPLATAAGHDVRVNVSNEPMILHGDAVRLTQVFGNLLNNSCRYTPPGGRITVTAERQGSDAVVTIADTGTGIPRDKLESIFEMFAQVDRSLERSQGGLGIGLTLVKRLVQMHGGSVEARSEGEGKGSEFAVHLPLATRVDEEPAAAPAMMPEVTQQRYRILVVDDSRDAAASLALLLQITGHETFMEHDGNAALAAAKRHRPEVVLLDIGLPGLSGFEVCKRIREQPWGADLLLIALTGWGQEEDRRRTREAGFDGHLVKPVDHGELLSLLNHLSTTRRVGQFR